MSRVTYLTITERHRLDDWGYLLMRAFNGETAYLVGSCIERPDYRDVDVRTMLDDDDYDKVASVMSVQRINDEYSMWGHAVTGLMIDFQVQKLSEANAEFGSRPRHALIGMFPQVGGWTEGSDG